MKSTLNIYFYKRSIMLTLKNGSTYFSKKKKMNFSSYLNSFFRNSDIYSN